MKFSLVVCTYKRPEALEELLISLKNQLLTPDEVLIIDGSPDIRSREISYSQNFPQLKYYQVEERDRGLTRQRNLGVSKVRADVDVVCFLDDDVVLTPDYFQNLIRTYSDFPDAVGVGGYILNEVYWAKKDGFTSVDEFEMDGYKRKLGSRNLLRKKIGLLSDKPPGVMPLFSHGLSTGFLPPSGKTYAVEYFMGGVASYRKELLDRIQFSPFFEGYGLYEDMDFCLRASKLGQLYVNTSAQLYHHHRPGGRPNKFKYGQMVMRNGWYVWRLKYPKPNLTSVFRWHGTAFLLTLVRMGNVVTKSNRKEALTESLGRISGWFGIIFNPPRHET